MHELTAPDSAHPTALPPRPTCRRRPTSRSHSREFISFAADGGIQRACSRRLPAGAAEAAATTAESLANCARLHLLRRAGPCTSSRLQTPRTPRHSPVPDLSAQADIAKSQPRIHSPRTDRGDTPRSPHGASAAHPAARRDPLRGFRPCAQDRPRHEPSAQADITSSLPRFQSPRTDRRSRSDPLIPPRILFTARGAPCRLASTSAGFPPPARARRTSPTTPRRRSRPTRSRW